MKGQDERQRGEKNEQPDHNFRFQVSGFRLKVSGSRLNYLILAPKPDT
jgi:hypothetical protein